MILLGAGAVLLGSEIVCFQVHTGAFPSALLLAALPLSHAVLFHFGLTQALFLLQVILAKCHLSWLYTIAQVYVSQFNMRQQGRCVSGVTYPLSSPFVLWALQGCLNKPLALEREWHLEQTHQETGCFRAEGVEGAKGHAFQGGERWKVPEKDERIRKVTIATFAWGIELFCKACCGNTQNTTEHWQDSMENAQLSPVVGFALSGNI